MILTPEVDSVLPGEAEGNDVAAGDVVDEVVEVGFAFVLGVKLFGHLEKQDQNLSFGTHQIQKKFSLF